MPLTRLDAVRWIYGELNQSLGLALEAMTGESAGIVVQEQETGTDEEIRWWRFRITPLNGGSAWLGGPKEACEQLARLILQGAGAEQPAVDDLASTIAEIAGQGVSGLARSLSIRLGEEVTCSPDEASPPHGNAHRLQLRVKLGEREIGPFWAAFDPAIFLALTETVAPPAQLQVAGAPPSGLKDREGTGDRDKATMDLLLEVELPVSVSFGRAHLPLKDVIKLSTGSIVELNRSLTEPVEIIVNNCVIARGEVVVIEGNYGVRIHEIVSREQRLRTLH
jgi:flagellar motor switch protein FliN/FliY